MIQSDSIQVVYALKSKFTIYNILPISYYIHYNMTSMPNNETPTTIYIDCAHEIHLCRYLADERKTECLYSVIIVIVII